MNTTMNIRYGVFNKKTEIPVFPINEKVESKVGEVKSEPLISLEEIIYEITGSCRNACSYCGSKDQWNKPVDTNTIDKIVDAIAEFPPKAIDISGGDPLLVPYDTHKRLVQKLKNKNILVKILFNPKSFRNSEPLDIKYTTLNLYDWIGISINTQNEIDLFLKHIQQHKRIMAKSTIITNFNTSNVFLFKNIKTLVELNNLTWQIQYTTYKEENDPNAIYNNEDALKYLFEKIQNSFDENLKIVLADDMTGGRCPAGIKSIGILSTGDVIPCLSMRSWISNISEVKQGNVLDTPLGFIWEHEFRDSRFNVCKSCKDQCKNKAFTPNSKISSEIEKYIPPEKYNPADVISKFYVYGVAPNRYTSVYAVSADYNSSELFKTPPIENITDIPESIT